MIIRGYLNYLLLLLALLPFFSCCKTAPAVKDVIKIMSYNVLKYGDGCQGPATNLHGYLKTIISYTDPDILGLIKVEAIPAGPGGKGKAPAAFADSILKYALNTNGPGKYARCPYTNA